MTQLLACPRFYDEWRALHRRCPWATVYQDVPFARTWYDVYRDVYEPWVVLERDSRGDLVGLLTLALHGRSGRLVPAGAQHAEYGAWLAPPEHGDAFIAPALDALRAALPCGRLDLKFLPSRAPLDWLRGSPRWRLLCDLRPTARPLMALDESSLRSSLRKSSNKSRIKRLERLGKLEFQRVRSLTEIETDLDTIADFCDFRQGAVNASLPFRADPLKRRFYAALLDQPELMHATVWRLDGRVISAHLGLRDRDQVGLGLITHSPFVAEHSPGKLHVLLLGLNLLEEHVRVLDLTPEGGYKERFATHHDEVYRLKVDFRPADACRRRLKALAVGAVKGALQTASISPERARGIARHATQRLADSVRLRPRPSVNARSAGESLNLYRVDIHAVVPAAAPSGVCRNDLGHLLSYRPRRPGDPTVPEFLRDALGRLECGDHVYSFVENGSLVQCVWTSASVPESVRGAIVGECRLLDRFWVDPDRRGGGVLRASIGAIARGLRDDGFDGALGALVPTADRQTGRELEALGFRCTALPGSAVRPAGANQDAGP